MARFNAVGVDDIIASINRRTEKAVKKIPKMLEAGAAVLVEAQKAEIDTMIAQGLAREPAHKSETSRSLGELKKSIKATKVKTDKSGSAYVEVYPHGKDSKGESNATKGFVLEYGRTNMSGYPWMTSANEKAADAVSAAQREVWEEDSDG